MLLEESVAPDKISETLGRIWNSLEKARKMRASLFNLILYTEKGPRAPYVQKITQAVIEKFPSRILFISADKNAKEESVRSKVAVLPVGSEDSEIACDFIEFEVSGSCKRIPHLILPHILPDLPVYLLWAEDPTLQDPVESELEKFATRIIFDSESTCNLPSFASTLLERKEKHGIDIADLNWARTESWRDVLSTTFYAQEKLADLKDAQTIQIVYNARESSFFCHTRIQSIYIASWLTSQLGWKIKKVDEKKESLNFLCAKEKENVTISLIPTNQAALPAGMILSLELKTYQDSHYSFLRSPENTQQITVTFSTKTFCEFPSHFLFAKGAAGQSLVKEICHNGTSEHFMNVLLLLKQTNL